MKTPGHPRLDREFLPQKLITAGRTKATRPTRRRRGRWGGPPSEDGSIMENDRNISLWNHYESLLTIMKTIINHHLNLHGPIKKN